MKIIRHLDSKGVAHYASEQADGSALRIEGDIYGSFSVTSEVADVVRLLAPVVPAQILCIGLNYKKHAEETGAKLPERPVLFVKGINALQHPGEPILLPRHLRSDEVDYECELAVVIGRACKNVSREHALEYVLGYTCANDVSARDHQIKLGGSQWCRGKFFDTFAPLGPRLVTADELLPNNLRIHTELNGEIVQDSRTSDMAFDVPAIIEYLSGSTTLVPGTVILTGTPSGVGMAVKPVPRWLRAGDEVTIEIEGIGRLTNPVKEE
ncbi:MAG: 7-dioic acid hydratase (catechol pathway) [Verrucomicrobia bacterium]|nr:MAG: 7-dioic acid hydratase (catechol pathway) [Verrucomicrobiota bacterium]